jgi:hypothetical protein
VLYRGKVEALASFGQSLRGGGEEMTSLKPDERASHPASYWQHGRWLDETGY